MLFVGSFRSRDFCFAMLLPFFVAFCQRFMYEHMDVEFVDMDDTAIQRRTADPKKTSSFQNV